MRRRLAILLAALAALVLSSCSSSTGPDQPVLPDAPDIAGLVAFYQFNGTLEDGSDNGLDAESVDAVTYIQDHAGQTDAALFVDGYVDTIRVPNRGAFDITGELTIAAWIRPNLCNMAYNAFVDKSLVDAWSMGVVGAMAPGRTDLVLYVHDEDAFLTDGAPVGQGVWEHVVCTFDDAADTAKFYVDGEFAGAVFLDASLTVSGTDLMIGSSHWHDNYKGGLDQLAIFDRVLTQAEIRELYEFD